MIAKSNDDLRQEVDKIEFLKIYPLLTLFLCQALTSALLTSLLLLLLHFLLLFVTGIRYAIDSILSVGFPSSKTASLAVYLSHPKVGCRIDKNNTFYILLLLFPLIIINFKLLVSFILEFRTFIYESSLRIHLFFIFSASDTSLSLFLSFSLSLSHSHLFSFPLLSTSKSTGLIQLIPDATSLDGLKKSKSFPGSLRGHFTKVW